MLSFTKILASTIVLFGTFMWKVIMFDLILNKFNLSVELIHRTVPSHLFTNHLIFWLQWLIIQCKSVSWVNNNLHFGLFFFFSFVCLNLSFSFRRLGSYMDHICYILKLLHNFWRFKASDTKICNWWKNLNFWVYYFVKKNSTPFSIVVICKLK